MNWLKLCVSLGQFSLIKPLLFHLNDSLELSAVTAHIFYFHIALLCKNIFVGGFQRSCIISSTTGFRWAPLTSNDSVQYWLPAIFQKREMLFNKKKRSSSLWCSGFLRGLCVCTLGVCLKVLGSLDARLGLKLCDAEERLRRITKTHSAWRGLFETTLSMLF